MLVGVATPSVFDVLAALRRDGIYVLDGVLSPGETDALREEAEWFLAEAQPWCKLDRQGPELYATVAPRAVPRPELPRLERISTLFSQGFFESVCKGYLGPNSIVDRIIFSKSDPSDRPITLWHVDQQAQGRLSFKFMLYLTGASADTGAFSYVRGSHVIVQDVMRRAALQGIPNTELHSFQQISEAVDRFGSAAQKRWFDEVRHHINGDYDSDDHYSIEAKEGSILLFDTKGFHRGGVVLEGERVLVRIHCFEPEWRAPNLPWRQRLLGRVRQVRERVRRIRQPSLFGWG